MKALLVIDYQNDFVSPVGKIAKRSGLNPTKLQNIYCHIKDLIDLFHKKHCQVIYILSDYNTKYYQGAFKSFRKYQSIYGNTGLKDSWGHQLFGLSKNQKDKIIVKHFSDSFYKTDLGQYLQRRKIKELFVCGIHTDVCVFQTTIGAAIRGFNVFVVRDATETLSKNKKMFLEYLKDFLGVKIVDSKKIIL